MEYNPGNQKPTRNGVYLRTLNTMREYACPFKDGKWMNYAASYLISTYQKEPWREPLTKWFDGKTTCPAKPGVYETSWHKYHTPFYNYWDGKVWSVGNFSFTEAAKRIGKWPQGHNPDKWRGFTCNQEV